MKKLYIANPPHICVLGMATCAALFLGLSAAQAQQVNIAPNYVVPAYTGYSGNDVGFYLNGALGPSFMPDFQSSRFGFPGNFSLRPGVRFDVEPGYNFLATDRLTLGAEFETGLIYNRIRSLTDTDTGESYWGDYYQTPLLGNVVLKLHPNSFVVPYVGVGGGGDASWARIHQPGFYGFDSHSDEVDPAAQGMAGVRFRLASNIDLGVGYEFLAAFPDEGSYVGTHSALASFTVRF